MPTSQCHPDLYALAQGLLHRRPIAWTGGSRPLKFLRVSQLERVMRSMLFRRDVAVFGATWHLTMADARTCYIGAKYDAHATLRPLTEA